MESKWLNLWLIRYCIREPYVAFREEMIQAETLESALELFHVIHPQIAPATVFRYWQTTIDGRCYDRIKEIG